MSRPSSSTTAASTPDPDDPRTLPGLLWWFAACNFVIGTGAFGMSGYLGPRRTIALLLGILSLVMVAVPWTAGHLAWTAAVFAVWTVCGFGLMTPQQSRLAELAFTQAPLLLSVNASMVYIGTALGSAIGGAALAVVGFERLSWLGALFVAAALATLALPPGGPQRPRRAE
ncbi:hypothetical protein ACPP3B_02980 [Tepidimonas sp. HKU77]|uniref:hypothetical protein n=1 Tax=Tepidimonas sp. HKU77 TaxID=3414503 RepID=UPI003C7C65C2